MPPSNDDLANAQLLVGQSPTASGTTVGSTNESDEITEGLDSGAGDVWYLWQAPFSGVVQFTLNAVGMDGEFDVYGALASGNTFSYINNTFLTWNFLSGFGGTTSSTLMVTAGNFYLIQVPYYSVQGTFDIGIVYNTIAIPPVNDFFADATPITIRLFPISADNTYATTEIGEPTDHYNSLWYSFTSPSDGLITLTIGSGFAVSVYTGEFINELNPVNPITGLGNNITVPIFPNLNYSIVIYSTTDTSYGPFTLTASFVSIPYPPNDNFSNAIALEGTIFSQSTDNSLASTELYEDPTNYFSLWYSFRSTSSVYFTLAQTAGISLNFKVYNGIDIENAIEVASSNDSIGVVVIPNVTYYIAVSSQSPTSYGEFSFGGGVGEFPFVYIGPTSPSLVLNSNGLNSIVFDSSINRIYSMYASGISIYYSDDFGLTWNLDRAFTFAGPPYYDALPALFLDENGNLEVAFITDNGSATYYFNVSVRNKSTGSWTDYTSSGIVSVQRLAFAFGFCQSNDGTIHCALGYNRNGIANFFGLPNRNIMYINFKDATFSTATAITQYSYNQDAGFHSIQLVNWNNAIYIFWRMDIDTTNSNGTLNYCIINPTSPLVMDAIVASTAWVTSITYHVGDIVTDTSYSPGTLYICAIQHTSGTFATDLGNGDWTVLSSYTTPTTLPTLVNMDVYNVKSDGTNLYFCAGNGFSPTLSLYENYVNISVSAPWYAWMTLTEFEIAMNGDIVVYGVDNRVFGGEPSVVARIGGVWQPEHTGPNNDFVGGHTYNFAIIR